MFKDFFYILIIFFLLSVPMNINANDPEIQNDFFINNELSIYRHWTNYYKRSTKNSINNITSSDAKSDTYYFPYLDSSILFGSHLFSFKGGISKDEQKIMRVEYTFLFRPKSQYRSGVGIFYRLKKMNLENEITENGIFKTENITDVSYIGGLHYLVFPSENWVDEIRFEGSYEQFKSPELIFFYDENNKKIRSGFDKNVKYSRLNFALILDNYRFFSIGHSSQHLIVSDFEFKFHYGFADISKELVSLVETDTNLDVESYNSMLGLSIKVEPGYMLKSLCGNMRTSVKLSYLFELHNFADDFEKENVSKGELRPGITHAYFNYGPQFTVFVVF